MSSLIWKYLKKPETQSEEREKTDEQFELEIPNKTQQNWKKRSIIDG